MLAPETLLVIVAAAAYGIFVGAIPGLTATMAVALMVPLTFFLSDVQAIAAIVTTVTCSIFSGDIPATLVRIPGTPASAAYADDCYAFTLRGQHDIPLRVSLACSVIGGLFGTLTLMLAAPQLATFAAQFTSYEYFWLYVLGLTCAAVVSDEDRLKGALSLFIGLLLSTVGLGTDYSVPRLTFGVDGLIAGISFIPAMIGLFGISEVLRNALVVDPARADAHIAEAAAQVTARSSSETEAQAEELVSGDFRVGRFAWQRRYGLLRSSLIGSFIGMLPGAGADIAAWIAYAVSKRFSKRPQDYGRGSLEGIADATGANDAALGSAWIPALVFGIPGDSVTAIAIGVLLMKNITPGPDIFDASKDAAQATLVFSIYVTFVIANLVLLPIGWAAIALGGFIIRIPRHVLLPLIVMFCVIGSYAMNGSYFDVWVMLAMGILGFLLERWGVPLAPIVLGLILGGELEHKFLQCWTKDQSITAFLNGSVSLVLAVACLVLWFAAPLAKLQKMARDRS